MEKKRKQKRSYDDKLFLNENLQRSNKTAEYYQRPKLRYGERRMASDVSGMGNDTEEEFAKGLNILVEDYCKYKPPWTTEGSDFSVDTRKKSV